MWKLTNKINLNFHTGKNWNKYIKSQKFQNFELLWTWPKICYGKKRTEPHPRWLISWKILLTDSLKSSGRISFVEVMMKTYMAFKLRKKKDFQIPSLIFYTSNDLWLFECFLYKWQTKKKQNFLKNASFWGRLILYMCKCGKDSMHLKKHHYASVQKSQCKRLFYCWGLKGQKHEQSFLVFTFCQSV